MSDFSTKIRSQFTFEELETYVNYFEIFDLDGDGTVSARNSIMCPSNMGYNLTKADIEVSCFDCYMNQNEICIHGCYSSFTYTIRYCLIYSLFHHK